MQLSCVFVLLLYGLFGNGVFGEVNGGIQCAACTIAVGLIEQLAIVNKESIDESVSNVCNLLPTGIYEKACKGLVDALGPAVIVLLYEELTPDITCAALGFCYTEPDQPQCNLFPLPPKNQHIKHETDKYAKLLKELKHKYGIPQYPDVCKIPAVKLICDILERTYEEHITSVDVDGDGYSSAIETFRGYDWKGKDCNDLYKYIHPGASTLDSDVVFDANCNGIYGRDGNGIPYEKLFCNTTQSKGIVILGDSASAHFHLPVQWLQADKLNKEIFETLPYVVENEFDWPHMSATTGYRNVTWSIIDGPVDSIYLRMRELNRCNHRDYQNLCVNGADSFKMLKYVKSLVRNQTTDNPVLASIALVGNDVCNHYPDSVSHMTTPTQMEENILKLLQYLDTRLPEGSHIILTGLADGRVLYNSLHERLHPFGELVGDIKYPQFYEFLKCLQITPCAGWMTANETLRNLTSQRAADLSKAISNVVENHKFKHFTASYMDCPFMQVIRDWEKKHGPGTAYQLIEPIDGFHPNQYAQAGIAATVWKHLKDDYPEFIGKTNPFNDKIEEIFGDQGGH